MASATSSYTFDNAWQAARERLEASEAWLDPWSQQELKAVGVAAGWKCLEIGAGGGSIGRWLAGQAGPDGHVVATDLDTRILEGSAGPHLEVRQHDLNKDTLEQGWYDLVHARLVLSHLANRDEMLEKLIAALRPGGWIVIEDFDHLTLKQMSVPSRVSDQDATAYKRLLEIALRFLASRGVDGEFGCRLYGLLRAQGLTDVHAEGRVSIDCGGSPFMRFLRLSAAQAGPALVGKEVTQEEFQRFLELCEEPHFTAASHTLVSARGRKQSS